MIGVINGAPAREHFLARHLEEAGFVNTVLGFQMRRVTPIVAPEQSNEDDSDDEESPGVEVSA